MPLPILPRPKKVIERKGQFRFDRPALIVLSPQADDAERTAAAVLADAVEQLGGPTVSIERHGRLDGLGRAETPIVQMFLLGRDEDLKLCPNLAKLVGGPGPRTGRLTERLRREGYALEVTPKSVLVVANSSAGLFYAAQTLVQMLEVRPGTRSPAPLQGSVSRLNGRPVAPLESSVPASRRPGVSASSSSVAPSPHRPVAPSPFLPCCRIVDWPDFAYRGFMLDVSRFRVPTTETLADLVFRLAACKINVLQLYVEHTFRCRRRPEYSQGVSPLTAEQLADLDQLCRSRHIELQANQNSLGHMGHLLSRPQFAHLAERTADMPPLPGPRGNPFPQPWSFRLDSPAVYELLDDIYAEHLPAVRSPLVNLGCDEVWDMGTGRSKAVVEGKGKVRAFVDHVKRIAALARKYGKQTMIWDDMIRHNPEVLAMLPRDIIPIYWHYERENDGAYEKMWAESSHRHWVAPGCCGWQTIFAQTEKAWANLHWLTAAGRAGGAQGVLNTEWGDGGNFQTLAVSYWSIALGAELSWNVDATGADVRRAVLGPGISPSPTGSLKGSGRGELAPDFDRRFAQAMFADRSGRMGRLYRLMGRTNSVFRTLGYQGIPFVLYWADFPHATNWSSMTKLPQPRPGELRRCQQAAEQALALAHQIVADPPAGVDDPIMEELISAARQTILACRKGLLALRVREALRAQRAGAALPSPAPAQFPPPPRGEGRGEGSTQRAGAALPSPAPAGRAEGVPISPSPCNQGEGRGEGASPRAKLPADLKREVKQLAADWQAQKSDFRRVWLLRNEPGQIAYRLGLYDERYKDFVKLLGRPPARKARR